MKAAASTFGTVCLLTNILVLVWNIGAVVRTCNLLGCTVRFFDFPFWTHLLNVWTFDVYSNHVTKSLCKTPVCLKINIFHFSFSFFHFSFKVAWRGVTPSTSALGRRTADLAPAPPSGWPAPWVTRLSSTWGGQRTRNPSAWAAGLAQTVCNGLYHRN